MPNGQHGGYRRPNKPAAVSGPGALSARTDGGATSQPQMVAPGGEYGSRQEMASIQGGADMQGGGGAPPAIPLGDPSMAPEEPITAGADLGAGIGAAGAGILSDQEMGAEQLRPLMSSLELVANLPGSNAQTRALVRYLKAKLSNG